MADLGQLQTLVSPLARVIRTGVWWATAAGWSGATRINAPAALARVVPPEFGPASEVLLMPADGVVSGTVLDGTSPVPDCTVALFHSITRSCMATTRTNASGFFSFAGLIRRDDAYFAVAFPPAALQKNALIFFRITPI